MLLNRRGMVFPDAVSSEASRHLAFFRMQDGLLRGRGARYDTRICAIGGLYPRAHRNFGKAETAMVRVDALPSGAEKIAVAPLDSFGNKGRSLSATIPAML